MHRIRTIKEKQNGFRIGERGTMPLLVQESIVSPLTTFLLDGTQSVPTKAWGVPTVPPTVPVVLCKEVQKGWIEKGGKVVLSVSAACDNTDKWMMTMMIRRRLTMTSTMLMMIRRRRRRRVRKSEPML